jgi:hypothetical protein
MPDRSESYAEIHGDSARSGYRTTWPDLCMTEGGDLVVTKPGELRLLEPRIPGTGALFFCRYPRGENRSGVRLAPVELLGSAWEAGGRKRRGWEAGRPLKSLENFRHHLCATQVVWSRDARVRAAKTPASERASGVVEVGDGLPLAVPDCPKGILPGWRHSSKLPVSLGQQLGDAATGFSLTAGFDDGEQKLSFRTERRFAGHGGAPKCGQGKARSGFPERACEWRWLRPVWAAAAYPACPSVQPLPWQTTPVAQG